MPLFQNLQPINFQNLQPHPYVCGMTLNEGQSIYKPFPFSHSFLCFMRPVVQVDTSGNLGHSPGLSVQCIWYISMEHREPMFLVLGISRNYCPMFHSIHSTTISTADGFQQ